jgi:cytidine deaminase
MNDDPKKAVLDPDDPKWAELAAAAREASQRSYSPYSRFPVGAAVLTGDGQVFAGTNIENASYGLTLCAERVAVFQAVAAGARSLVACVVYTPTSSPTAPCGACRQVLNEFGPSMAIRCLCEGPATIESTLDRLLPSAFGPGNLAR